MRAVNLSAITRGDKSTENVAILSFILVDLRRPDVENDSSDASMIGVLDLNVIMSQCHNFTGGVSASTFAPKNLRGTSFSFLIGRSVRFARGRRPERVSESKSSKGGGDGRNGMWLRVQSRFISLYLPLLSYYSVGGSFLTVATPSWVSCNCKGESEQAWNA